MDTSRCNRAKCYGRIVLAGVGDGDVIGDIIGDGDMTGCALAAEVVAAPAMHAPARITPINHRFIDLSSSFVPILSLISASYPRHWPP